MSQDRIHERLDQIAEYEQNGQEVPETLMEEAKAEIAASGLTYFQLYLGRGEYHRQKWLPLENLGAMSNHLERPQTAGRVPYVHGAFVIKA
jgi:hypothetical protein